jgi:uncharacterized protein (DUF433 family)
MLRLFDAYTQLFKSWKVKAYDEEGETYLLKLTAILRRGNYPMDETALLNRIMIDPKIFGGKPIIRGRRLAVEHVLSMLAAGDTEETILQGYPWLERDDILACLVYASRLVSHERVEPLILESAS